jgi:hypothetical protein
MWELFLSHLYVIHFRLQNQRRKMIDKYLAIGGIRIGRKERKYSKKPRFVNHKLSMT